MGQPPFTVHIRHELVEIVTWLLSPPKESRRVHLGSLDVSSRLDARLVPRVARQKLDT